MTIFLLSAYIFLSACSTPRVQTPSSVNQLPVLSQNGFTANDGYYLPFVRYWPENKLSPKALVLALHGFNDYSKAFEGMCQYFVAYDLACIAYDQRGFGATDMVGLWPAAGRLQQDLRQFIQALHQENENLPIFLVGESMGGAVIMTALTDSRAATTKMVEGILLYAPAVWARSTQPWYQRLSLWLAVHTFPGWMPTGEGLGVQATDNIDALRAMGRDDKVIKATRIDTIYGLTNLMDSALFVATEMPLKTLVLYGDKDEVIPKKPTCEMLEAMKSSEQDVVFMHYPEGYHMLTRDLQAHRIFDDSLLWMFDRLNKEHNFEELRLNSANEIDFCK